MKKLNEQEDQEKSRLRRYFQLLIFLAFIAIGLVYLLSNTSTSESATTSQEAEVIQSIEVFEKSVHTHLNKDIKYIYPLRAKTSIDISRNVSALCVLRNYMPYSTMLSQETAILIIRNIASISLSPDMAFTFTFINEDETGKNILHYDSTLISIGLAAGECI
jgi:hypothetical protein